MVWYDEDTEHRFSVAFLVPFAVAFLVGWQITMAFHLKEIERKIDAMNTCGPAEVVVSGERE